MKIYLHIGAPKCASSSIQSYFSHNYSIKNFAYGCLRESGRIMVGEKVRDFALASPTNYAASWKLGNVVEPDFIERLGKSLDEISKKHDILLLSSEGWLKKSEQFSVMSKAFQKYETEVIMIVRPPVLWMNSAWWQWLQWSGNRVDPWANNGDIATRWLTAYQSYSKIPFVNKVNVLALDNNILTTFGGLMSVDVDQDVKSHNVGSSAELLSFFKMKRSLRKGVHAAKNEFILNKYLSKRSPTDWVLTKKNVTSILKNTRNSCEKLSEHIVNKDIADDELWWVDKAYQQKVTNLNRKRELSNDDLSSMLEEAYKIIIELDRKAHHINEAEKDVLLEENHKKIDKNKA